MPSVFGKYCEAEATAYHPFKTQPNVLRRATPRPRLGDNSGSISAHC